MERNNEFTNISQQFNDVVLDYIKKGFEDHLVHFGITLSKLNGGYIWKKEGVVDEDFIMLMKNYLSVLSISTKDWLRTEYKKRVGSIV